MTKQDSTNSSISQSLQSILPGYAQFFNQRLNLPSVPAVFTWPRMWRWIWYVLYINR